MGLKLRKYLYRVFQKKAIRSIAALIFASAGGQLILVAASPLLTRLYTPEEFGILAVFSAMLSVLSVVASLRYEMAIPLPKNKDKSTAVLVIALSANFGFSLILLIVSLLFSEQIAVWVGVPQMKTYLWLLPVAVFLVSLYKIFSFWAIRHHQYKQVAQTKVWQGIGNVGVQIAGGLLGVGAIGLLLGRIVGQALGVKKLYGGINFSDLWMYLRDRRGRVKAEACKYRNFPKYDMPASFLNTLSNELPPLVFTALFGPAIAGFYLLAQRVLATPLNLVGQAVAQVLYGNARQAIESLQLQSIVCKTVLALTCLIVIPFFLVYFWGVTFFTLVFGSEWATAGQVSALLMYGISAQFIYSPISLILLATNAQHLNLFLNIMMMALRGAGIYWGWLHDDVMMAVLYFSLAGLVSYSVGIMLVLLRVRQYKIVV